jgi:hypothetical protein
MSFYAMTITITVYDAIYEPIPYALRLTSGSSPTHN